MSNTGKLAAMHVNDAGGIEALDGAQLRFVNADNEGTQELGGEVEQQLIDEGAHVLTGCFSSPVTLAATQVAERAGIPHVIDVSVANDILQGRGLNYVYRIQTPASGMAGNYVEFMPTLARENGQTMDSASLVYLDNSFGQSIRQTLVEELPSQNVELVMESAYSFGQESLDTEATQVKEADADAFIFVGYGAGGIRMMQSLQNVEYRPPLMTGTSTPTFTDSDVIDQIGRFANGGFGNNYSWDYNKELTDRVFADYRTEYDRPLGVTHAVMTYSTVAVIRAALEEAGSVEPDDINEALKNVSVEDHPAAMGPIEFQENGENANALSPMFQVQELDPVLVWPEQYAQGEPQF
jgi:branched-chain amino acid transport system substrate-binding protein